jgi:hypothetical protein
VLIGSFTVSSWARMLRSMYNAQVRHLFSKPRFNINRLKQLHDAHNVLVIFPNESDEQSTAVLVYDPMTPSASPLPNEKNKHLDDAEKEILKLAKDAADVKSELVVVEKRWHDAVAGHGGTTLNA